MEQKEVKSGMNGSPFNDEIKQKLQMQQAILFVSQEILKERRDEVLARAQARLKTLGHVMDTTKK